MVDHQLLLGLQNERCDLSLAWVNLYDVCYHAQRHQDKLPMDKDTGWEDPMIHAI